MNRLFFLGFSFIVIAAVFWGAMGTAVQHLFLIKSGFSALGLVTLRQVAAGLLFVAVCSAVMPKKLWSVFTDRELVRDLLISGVLVFFAHYSSSDLFQCGHGGDLSDLNAPAGGRLAGAHQGAAHFARRVSVHGAGGHRCGPDGHRRQFE